MRTSTMVILGAAAAGAAWWWWSRRSVYVPTTRTLPPGKRPTTALPGIDWNFVDGLPIPGLSTIDENGMILRPAIYVVD